MSIGNRVEKSVDLFQIILKGHPAYLERISLLMKEK
jgi:hypothetical protein